MLMLFVYRLLIYISLPFVFLNFYWRSIKSPEYSKRMLERFAVLDACPQSDGIWVHCVSVGETKAAIPMIRVLLQQFPEVPVTVTCTTPTGSHEIKNAFADKVFHCYCPLDMPSVVNRFLNKVQPKVAIMVETEVWPFTLLECQKRHITTMLINGRMSESSAKGYLKISGLTRRVFGSFSLVAAQYPSDAERFVQLGVNPEHMVTSGSVKFDISPDEELIAKGNAFKQYFNDEPIFVAASTHASEDEVAIEAFRQLKKINQRLKMIIVPRHPERFDTVKGLLEHSEFSYVCRSTLISTEQQLEQGHSPDTLQPESSQNSFNMSDIDIMLGDTMGELLMMYVAADIAFVGGSLVEIGGHNILEAAVFGKPTIIGPNYFNFQDVSQEMIDEGACFVVKNAEELASTVNRLITRPELYQKASEAAEAVMKRNRGSLKYLSDAVLPIVAERCLKD